MLVAFGLGEAEAEAGKWPVWGLPAADPCFGLALAAVWPRTGARGRPSRRPGGIGGGVLSSDDSSVSAFW